MHRYTNPFRKSALVHNMDVEDDIIQIDGTIVDVCPAIDSAVPTLTCMREVSLAGTCERL